jgi:hypothetical protein
MGTAAARTSCSSTDEVLAGKVDIEDTLRRYTDVEVAAMREEVITMIPKGEVRGGHEG